MMMATLCVIRCRQRAIFVQFEMYLRVTAGVLRARFLVGREGKGRGDAVGWWEERNVYIFGVNAGGCLSISSLLI